MISPPGSTGGFPCVCCKSFSKVITSYFWIGVKFAPSSCIGCKYTRLCSFPVGTANAMLSKVIFLIAVVNGLWIHCQTRCLLRFSFDCWEASPQPRNGMMAVWLWWLGSQLLILSLIMMCNMWVYCRTITLQLGWWWNWFGEQMQWQEIYNGQQVLQSSVSHASRYWFVTSMDSCLPLSNIREQTDPLNSVCSPHGKSRV